MVITQLFAFLDFIGNVDVAQHIDIDGTKQELAFNKELYEQTVEEARSLVRTLEAAVQALYDDGSTLLMAIQSLPNQLHSAKHGKERSFDIALALSDSLKVKLPTVFRALETLLFIGNHQADVHQGDCHGFIQWKMNRERMVEYSIRRLSTMTDKTYIPENGDAFSKHTKTSSISSFASSTWETGIILPDGITLPNIIEVRQPFEHDNTFDADESVEGNYLRESLNSITATAGTRSSLALTIKPEAPVQPTSAPWSTQTLVDPECTPLHPFKDTL
jgi:hypothetical protein